MRLDNYHTPVLVEKVIEFLDPRPGKSYIDATVGGGGHSFALLQKGARVLGIDRDEEAIDYVTRLYSSSESGEAGRVEKLKQYSSQQARTIRNLTLAQGNFSKICEIAKGKGFDKVDGILFDLGVSSHQLEEPSRGFSFLKEGPLDMRMDSSINIKAADIINNLQERRLNEIFQTFGQEEYSRRIAGAICSARKVRPIETTKQLANIVEEALRGVRRNFKINRATKVFQALRIVVNSELLNLEEALPQTIDLLRPKGRLAIISFHSLEDRAVKRFLKKETRLITLTKKPIGPDLTEIESNPRSRSAKLRVAERI